MDPEYDLQYNTYIGHQFGPLSKDFDPRSGTIYVKVPFVDLGLKVCTLKIGPERFKYGS